MADLPRQLEAALAATSAALQSGDGQAADQAARQAAAICTDLERSGQRLPQDLLARAMALQERCVSAAAGRMAQLTRELDTAARSRRAADAYRR